MIEVEVLTSPDQFSLGKVTFQKNLIYIGRKSRELNIQEPEVIHQHLMLEVIDDMILVHASPLIDGFLVNGKITKKIKPLKYGDIIRIGKTEIKLISAIFVPFKTTDDLKDEN